jgi:hypothetical protein
VEQAEAVEHVAGDRLGFGTFFTTVGASTTLRPLSPKRFFTSVMVMSDITNQPRRALAGTRPQVSRRFSASRTVRETPNR